MRRAFRLALCADKSAAPISIDLRKIRMLPRNDRLAETATSRIDRRIPALAPLGEIPQEALCTAQEIWKAPNYRAAWDACNKLLCETSDPAVAQKIRLNDLVTLAAMSAQAEVEVLLECFPPLLHESIVANEAFDFLTVEELFIHVGQNIEVRGETWRFLLPPVTAGDLSHILRGVGRFGTDGRGCLPGTLHRASCWRGRKGESLGVTLRVGRYVPNIAESLVPLAMDGNVLLLSKPGVGKTTVLRDFAARLSQDISSPRVVVIDTSNEIGGDSAIPQGFLGRARRVQVPSREKQLDVMNEVLRNHTPEIMIIDEISTQEEVDVAWSICQRGVRLVATCHAESLERLVQNQLLNKLVGGSEQAFLSSEERRMKQKAKKTILERPHSSPFEYVVELRARGVGVLYNKVNKAVDAILDEDRNLKVVLGECSGWVDLSKPLPERLKPGWKDSSSALPQIEHNREGYVVDHHQQQHFHHHRSVHHRHSQAHSSHRQLQYRNPNEPHQQQQQAAEPSSPYERKESLDSKKRSLLAEIDALL